MCVKVLSGTVISVVTDIRIIIEPIPSKTIELIIHIRYVGDPREFDNKITRSTRNIIQSYSLVMQLPQRKVGIDILEIQTLIIIEIRY
ncbi:hypothetical protein A15D_02785 [Alcanivorax sp. MD8A]|nr:hypothetical protein A15D_02785 [Alcanivorax sp. MD8A]